ncbi:LmeA family phospholipid-binding protein [Pantanalinema sp. GBBB05]|uniref:LmeA family phospholipid-binding protein n=1 Tax=Pantanalinema sp. GBBB05 TaxID=2604139 RepID=UPI001DA2593C|nr:DUF2993 domain-containing protein [Pantanalinema sp. GBBB05]
MTQGKPDLGEQAISKVAELGITSQLDEVEELNVDIRTDPGKIIQGQLDSVVIEGKGMVMQQDLRVEAIEINTDKIAINPLSVVFGDIELTHPTEAETHVVLTEADLNRALNSDYLRSKMQDLKITVEDKPVTIKPEHITLQLPGDCKFVLDATMLIRETGEKKQVHATAIPHVKDQGERISLEILAAEGQGLNSELVTALLNELTELLDLRNFELQGMTLRLKGLDAQAGRLVLEAATTIREFPS